MVKWLLRAVVVVVFGSAVAMTISVGVVARRSAIARQKVAIPQAILILDGGERRIRQAIDFARQHPTLPVWISGNCSKRATVQTIVNPLASTRSVYFDLRATDTVTHFTTLVDDFASQNIHHVYLVTSDYHLSRARVSARLVFGSRDIVFTPVSLASLPPSPLISSSASLPPSSLFFSLFPPLASGGQPQEPGLKSVRDALRSFLWLATRRTGASLNPHLHHLPGGVSCLSQVQGR